MDIQQVVKQSLPASRTTLDKLGPSLTRMIRISTVICYASHRAYLGRTRNCTGLHCWARGYGVRTVGCEEAVVRQDSRKQEEQEKRAEPLA
jgi:hypothetical protein